MAESTIIGVFSEDQAESLSGVSLNQLRRWAREGFFWPSYGAEAKGIPYGRLYSFRDIVSLRVLNDLRNIKKIPLSHLREVSRKLAHLGDAKWTATRLYVLGKRVVFLDPSSRRKREVVSGQGVLDIALKIVIASTRRAVEELNDRHEEHGQIVQDRFVVQNEPVIKGTRIPVIAIKGFAEAGYSPAQIIREYPDLNEEDILAALAYDCGAAAA